MPNNPTDVGSGTMLELTSSRCHVYALFPRSGSADPDGSSAVGPGWTGRLPGKAE